MASRREKYPDTKTFTFYNANPKGKFTGDCVVRAICTALEKPYEEVYRELLELCLKNGHSIASKENYSKYIESLGWKKQKQPRKNDNTKYTGVEFCKKLQKENKLNCNNIIAHIGGNHIVAIMDNKVCDTWDSTDGCIGNYWIKE